MSSGRLAPQISNNALRVLEKRYLRKNVKGIITETPEELFSRVASDIARAERRYGDNDNRKKWEDEFYNRMAQLEFLPNSPTLMNAGAELQQLSACFVLPINDSMESIFETIKNTALIHKSGGGTGFSFSRIRPKNDRVKTTKGISSGPISFMTVFDAATETVKQGGTRRGANMAILRVDHPDILEFITSKEDNKKLNNFNISVGVTEEFMEAVKADKDYELLNPHGGDVIDSIPARNVFNMIVELAWKNGEPGIVFLDRMNRNNPTPHVGEIESTNPCGEQPLLPYESCNLGSINLSRMVKDTGGRKTIDFAKLGSTVRVATRFLDDVIDRNRYPLEKIKEMTLSNRKIGLGVMGFADMLVQLGIPYDSDEALEVAEEVMGFIQKESRDVSIELAEERGAFPNFKGSVYDTKGAPKVRNSTTTTIAPTGTLSIIAGCSSGVEPLFAIAFIRNVMDNDELVEVNPMFRKIAVEEGFDGEELMKKIAREGTVQGIEEVPEKWRRIFVTAHDIKPEWHIKMQAAFQKYTDNAVSKTVNFPKSATRKDVEEVYLKAYELDCKGVTIYRDGSREEQVLNIGKVNRADESGVGEASVAEPSAGHLLTPRARPSVTVGKTWKMTTGCGNLYVTINEDEHGPFEVFTQMGKAGGCSASQSEAISRLISLSLRAGIDPKSILKQLHGIRCPNPGWEKGGMILSCSDAIAKALERHFIEEKQQTGEKVNKKTVHAVSQKGVAGLCPDCGGMMEHEGGCAVCRGCGFSKCG
ncbi:MAG: vitamin B12-dependent ribonucleotide reductase [Candidatus Krumholzibacteriota bacterium]|nr:vitamin B12-dependent ribonucleotide reductase [Candidatus Krumholzibacteriota bacterium]